MLLRYPVSDFSFQTPVHNHVFWIGLISIAFQTQFRILQLCSLKFQQGERSYIYFVAHKYDVSLCSEPATMWDVQTDWQFTCRLQRCNSAISILDCLDKFCCYFELRQSNSLRRVCVMLFLQKNHNYCRLSALSCRESYALCFISLSLLLVVATLTYFSFCLWECELQSLWGGQG